MAALFLIRVTAGLVFIFLAVLQLQYSSPPQFGFTLFSVATKGALSFFQPVYSEFFIPQHVSMYYCLVLTYFILGTSFILGAFVRITSFLLVLLGFIYMFSLMRLGFLYQVQSVTCIVLGVGFIINNPGKVLGVDQLFGKTSQTLLEEEAPY